MKFIVNKEFKDTEIGKIPKDWEVVKVKSLFKVVTGTTPSTKVKDYWNNGNIEWLTPKDLSRVKNSIFLPPSERKITKIALKDTNLTLLPKYSILISTRAPVGYVGINDKEVTFNQGCKGLIPLNRQICWPFYYAYYLRSKTNFLNSVSGGSTFKELSKDMLEEIIVPLPPLSEQQKIAEILLTVDSAIEKVNEEISKIEQLKKGLMQELLTKGIGHKEFKDSLIGKVPKEWETVKLSEIAKIIMGQSPPSSTYNNIGEGLPFLQGKLEFGEVYPSPKIYCSDPIKIAEAGDILISVRAPVGDVNLTPYKLCIGRGLAVIRINAKKGNYKFYFYYLKKEKDSWEKLSKGSTFKAINKSDIENFIVPLPSLSEQQKIAEILLTVDELLDLKKKKREKIEKLKNGLMNLLLTGKIRIIE